MSVQPQTKFSVGDRVRFAFCPEHVGKVMKTEPYETGGLLYTVEWDSGGDFFGFGDTLEAVNDDTQKV